MAGQPSQAWYVASSAERDEIRRNGIEPDPDFIAETVQLFSSHADAVAWGLDPEAGYEPSADVWSVDLTELAAEVEDLDGEGPDVSLAEPVTIPPDRLTLQDSL